MTKPTLAYVGEKGPEAIVPFAKMGGGLTVNVGVQVNVSSASLPVVVQATLAELKSKMLSSGELQNAMQRVTRGRLYS